MASVVARSAKAKPRKRAPKAVKVDEIAIIHERLADLDETVDQLGKMVLDLSTRVALLGSLRKKTKDA